MILLQIIYPTVNLCWLVWLSFRYIELDTSIENIEIFLFGRQSNAFEDIEIPILQHHENGYEFELSTETKVTSSNVLSNDLLEVEEPKSSTSSELRGRSRNAIVSDSKTDYDPSPSIRRLSKAVAASLTHTNKKSKDLTKIIDTGFSKPKIITNDNHSTNSHLVKQQKQRNAQRKRKISAQAPSTKCVLSRYSNSTSTIYFPIINQTTYQNMTNVFNLSLELFADEYASETSWTFYQINNKKKNNDTEEIEREYKDILIDFQSEVHEQITGSGFDGNMLHISEYSCYIDDSADSNNLFFADTQTDEICYEFEMRDQYGDGNCCWGGHGHYTLSLNNKFDEKSTTLAYGRLYAYVAITPFCIGGNSTAIHDKNDDQDSVDLYPSRECLNERCYCDSEPSLLSNFDNIESKYPGLHALKTRTIMNIMILSGPTTVQDINSPQYKAACWVLNDDPYLTQYYNNTQSELLVLDPEEQMKQRYILAVFYFATKPQNWIMHMNFLSQKPECQWWGTNADPIDNTPIGVGCDSKNDKIISLLIKGVNVDGTLVDEIYGLKSLEFLAIVKEPLIHGTIPTSFGLLSELRYLTLEESPFEGRIPEEIFNPSKFERLMITDTSITGSIPKSIEKMGNLQILKIYKNRLSGELPNGISQLTKLRKIELYENQFTSTIPELGNLIELRELRLHQNKFTGTIPNSIGQLTMLKKVLLSKNNLSGTIPATVRHLTDIRELDLFETNLEGEIPQELCALETKPNIKADCRNDVFQPSQSCSCCSYCTDETPTWNGNCPDSKLKIAIDHVEDGEYFTSELLEWSILDAATNRSIMSDGPYTLGISLKPSYESCIAVSDCFVLNMRAEPIQDVHYYPEHSKIGWKTNYSIYWDNELVLRDAFENGIDKSVVMPEIAFHYDEKRDMVEVLRHGSSYCPARNIECDGEIMSLDVEQRVLYNKALKVSGSDKFDDPLSPQTKALCWVFKNNEYLEAVESSLDAAKDVHTISTKLERYTLTLLHLTSQYKIFGNGEYPPDSYHCTWEGVECDLDEFKLVTSIFLNPQRKQIIGGPMIQELGSLPYLEKLILRQTGLNGTIPEVYSNLWSLVEIDLSRNDITGKIPDTFFRQLEKLEYFDLSENALSKEIPKDIGSYSSIRHLSLGGNQLTGSVPLDGFNMFNLEHFDVGNNLLGDIKFPLLLKHPNMKKLNLASNFFVGSLQNDTFKVLAELEYFNISQNEFSGTIPSSFPDVIETSPKLTQFDAHDNRLRGFVPSELAELLKIEHLNLQGNKLTGSIPSHLNSLTKLSVLALSHNELKGNIPLNLTSLENIKYLHLHANKLSGEAPRASNKMENYITDCGKPSAALNPVTCPSCNICCNSDTECTDQITSSVMRPAYFALIITALLIGPMVLIYVLKDELVQNRYFIKYFEESVSSWSAPMLIADKSIYHFFLIPSGQGWLIALSCSAIQLATLFLFVLHADTSNEETDMEYTLTCPSNSLECEDSETRSTFGYSIFGLLLVAWLLRDIVGSIKLFMLSLWKRKIDFLFASIIIIMVTLFSAMTSIYYNYAIATKDTDIITNAVILLFVNEIDERLFQLAEACNYYLVDEVDKSFKLNAYHDTRELVINQGIGRISNVFSIRKSTEVGGRFSSVFSSRRSTESIPGKVSVGGRLSDLFSTRRTSQDESIAEENVSVGVFSTRRTSQDESIAEEDVPVVGGFNMYSTRRRSTESIAEENEPVVGGFNMYSTRRLSQNESIPEETESEPGNSEHDSKGRRRSMTLTSGTF